GQPQPALRIVRIRIRREHGARRRENPRGGGQRNAGGTARSPGGPPATAGGKGVVYLRRPAHGAAKGGIPDGKVPLQKQLELTPPASRFDTRGSNRRKCRLRFAIN